MPNYSYNMRRSSAVLYGGLILCGDLLSAPVPDQVVVSQVAVLGAAMPSGGFAERPGSILRLRSGWFLVLPGTPSNPVVMDANGRVRRTLTEWVAGSKQVDVIFAGQGDSICAYDSKAAVVVVYDSTFTPGRVVRLDHPLGLISDAVMLANGGFVFSAPAHQADLIGQPLHHFGPSGSYLRSFGAKSDKYRPDRALQYRRLLAGGSGAELWIASAITHAAELWTLSGEMQRRVALPDSFPTYDTSLPAAGADRTPVTVLSSVRLDREGRLWFVARVPDSRWRESVAQYRASDHLIENADRYWDSTVEVFDPKLSRVVASGRFDQAFLSFAADG